MNFASNPATLVLDGTQAIDGLGTMAGFGPGSAIDLPGETFTTGDLSYNSATEQLTIDAHAGGTFTLDFTGLGLSTHFEAVPIAGGTGGIEILVSSMPSHTIVVNPNETVATPVGNATTVDVAAGGDNVIYSQGTDTVNAGTGSDRVFAAGASIVVNDGPGKLIFIAGGGSYAVQGGSGTSTIYGGTGIGSYIGGAAGNNVLAAAVGNTTLRGAGNGDVLFGSPTGDGNQL